MSELSEEEIIKYKKDCDLLELTDEELINEAKTTLINSMNLQNSGFRRIEKVALVGISTLLNLYQKEKEKNKRYKKALLYTVNQFAYDEKRTKQENELLYTGGLSTLEEIFDVLNIDEGIKRKDIWKMIEELLKENTNDLLEMD